MLLKICFPPLHASSWDGRAGFSAESTAEEWGGSVSQLRESPVVGSGGWQGGSAASQHLAVRNGGVWCGSAPQVSLDFVKSGSYQLERMGVSYPARAHTKSPFDPENKRVKGIY